MNINDLTIGQIKEISAMIGGQNEAYTADVFKIGKSYLFRTVTHIEVGRVKEVNGHYVTLEDASWIADTGRYHDCLRDGVFIEVEPYPDTTTINALSLINHTPWHHDLPKEQK